MPEPGKMLVTVDVAVFTEREGRLSVLLVERANDPHKGSWALPGGFVDLDEDLADAGARELAEETGTRLSPDALHQLGAYGAPGRDPRGRVVTVTYWAKVDHLEEPTAGSDASASHVVAVDDVLADPSRLAFDHAVILADAVAALRSPRGARGTPTSPRRRARGSASP